MTDKDTQRAISRRRFLAAAGAVSGGVAVGFGDRAFTNFSEDLVEVNVGYATGSGFDASLAEASTVVHQFGFDAVTIRLPQGAAKWLAERSDVRYVEENTQMRLHDGMRSQQLQPESQSPPSGVERVNGDLAHENEITGKGASIAIVDTGIASTHSDLEPNLGNGKSFIETESEERVIVDEDEDGTEIIIKDDAETDSDLPAWQDNHGHGTHCAGIAGAVDNDEGVVGVAPEARLHAVKIGSKEGIDASDVAAGIEHVAERGWDVANMSIGNEEPSSVIEDACKHAYENGVLLVASAGNIDEGEDNSIVRYPAAYDEVIAVSATTGDGDFADFSLSGSEVELAAPGEEIVSTMPDGEYQRESGTSMAAPHVTGAGALLMAQGHSNVETRERLYNTATDLDLDETEQGNGLLDVAAAFDLDSDTDS